MSTPQPIRIGARATFPTLAQIKEALGIAADDATKDAALTALLTATIAMIESYLGRGIALAHEVEEFDPPESRVAVLLLFRFPVQSVASITQNEQVISGYRVSKNSGVVRWRDGCCERVARYGCSELAYLVADYEGGYPDDAWPADLLDVVMRIFYARWHATGDTGNVGGIDATNANKSISVDGLTIEHRDPAQSTYAFGGVLIPVNTEIAPYAAQLEPYRAQRTGGL